MAYNASPKVRSQLVVWLDVAPLPGMNHALKLLAAAHAAGRWWCGCMLPPRLVLCPEMLAAAVAVRW